MQLHPGHRTRRKPGARTCNLTSFENGGSGPFSGSNSPPAERPKKTRSQDKQGGRSWFGRTNCVESVIQLEAFAELAGAPVRMICLTTPSVVTGLKLNVTVAPRFPLAYGRFVAERYLGGAHFFLFPDCSLNRMNNL